MKEVWSFKFAGEKHDICTFWASPSLEALKSSSRLHFCPLANIVH